MGFMGFGIRVQEVCDGGLELMAFVGLTRFRVHKGCKP